MSRDTLIKDTKRVLSGSDYEKETNAFAFIKSEGCIPLSRDYISLYADEACLEPCQTLYDLNIQTVNSGANTDNKDNIQAEGFIGIIYDTLSEENQAIVNEMIKQGIIESKGKYGDYTIFYLRVPLTSRSTVGEISDKLMYLVSQFRQQDVLYGRYTSEDIDSQYKPIDNGMYLDWLTHSEITEEEKEGMINQYLEQLYYDGIKYYYITEDLLKKHISYLEENSIKNL